MKAKKKRASSIAAIVVTSVVLVGCTLPLEMGIIAAEVIVFSDSKDVHKEHERLMKKRDPRDRREKEPWTPTY